MNIIKGDSAILVGQIEYLATKLSELFIFQPALKFVIHAWHYHGECNIEYNSGSVHFLVTANNKDDVFVASLAYICKHNIGGTADEITIRITDRHRVIRGIYDEKRKSRLYIRDIEVGKDSLGAFKTDIEEWNNEMDNIVDEARVINKPLEAE